MKLEDIHPTIFAALCAHAFFLSLKYEAAELEIAMVEDRVAVILREGDHHCTIPCGPEPEEGLTRAWNRTISAMRVDEALPEAFLAAFARSPAYLNPWPIVRNMQRYGFTLRPGVDLPGEN